jgi:hypothetical protein
MAYRTLPSGVSFYGGKGGGRRAAGVSFPFQVTLSRGEEEALFATVEPGTISGVMPKIDGTDIDTLPAPTLEVASTGTAYIYFIITATFNVTAEGYVLGAAASFTVSIDTGSTVPDDVKTSTFYRRIATVVDGVKTAQVVQNSLDIYFRDAGEGNSEADATFVVSG